MDATAAHDKIRHLARIKCERKCESNFCILYINTELATTTEWCTVTVYKVYITRYFGVTIHAAVPPAAAEDTLAPDNCTVHERSGRIIADAKIILDARLHIFTVDGTNELHVVRLFPRQSSSCPARTSCYHITAARLAVSLPHSGTRGPLNLSCTVTSDVVRTRCPDGSVYRPATSISCLQVTSMRTWQWRWMPSPTPADVEPSSPQ